MAHPFVISIPHCGSRVPQSIRRDMALDAKDILDATDLGSDVLFETLPAHAVLKAEFSRLVVDLNRDPQNRGPKGVVARTDYRGREIYKPGKYPDERAIDERVQSYHAPYHERLAREISDPRIAGLFDCHSLNGTAPVDAPDAGKKRLDIIISNNGNQAGGPDPKLGAPTASAAMVQGVRSALEAAGFSVSVNAPYQGGYITVHYGRALAARGKFAIQIEMNQDLYLDAEGIALDPEKTADVRSRIHSAFEEISRISRELTRPENPPAGR
jgi:N-formylglutamate amidohydrolase